MFDRLTDELSAAFECPVEAVGRNEQERIVMTLLTDLIYEMKRQHPHGATTWSNCLNPEKCGNSARGGGACADCTEKALSAAVGNDHAKRLRSAICELRDAEIDSMDYYDQRLESGDIVES